jgi:dihydroorotase
VENGHFVYVDGPGVRLDGTQRGSRARLTLRDGKVVYDLNGLTATSWVW